VPHEIYSSSKLDVHFHSKEPQSEPKALTRIA